MTVIVDVPAPWIVTILPEMVATDASLLVYVKAPVLDDAGLEIVKGVSVVNLLISARLIEPVSRETVSVAVVEPAA